MPEKEIWIFCMPSMCSSKTELCPQWCGERALNWMHSCASLFLLLRFIDLSLPSKLPWNFCSRFTKLRKTSIEALSLHLVLAFILTGSAPVPLPVAYHRELKQINQHYFSILINTVLQHFCLSEPPTAWCPNRYLDHLPLISLQVYWQKYSHLCIQVCYHSGLLWFS